VSESEESPVTSAFQSTVREKVQEALRKLGRREADVLRMRFGLDDGRSRTLEEVGQMFQVSRERIRQIEAKALRKLQQSGRARSLRDLLPAGGIALRAERARLSKGRERAGRRAIPA